MTTKRSGLAASALPWVRRLAGENEAPTLEVALGSRLTEAMLQRPAREAFAELIEAAGLTEEVLAALEQKRDAEKQQQAGEIQPEVRARLGLAAPKSIDTRQQVGPNKTARLWSWIRQHEPSIASRGQEAILERGRQLRELAAAGKLELAE